MVIDTVFLDQNDAVTRDRGPPPPQQLVRGVAPERRKCKMRLRVPLNDKLHRGVAQIADAIEQNHRFAHAISNIDARRGRGSGTFGPLTARHSTVLNKASSF